MDSNDIYEITKMVQHSGRLNEDFSGIMNSIRDVVQNKYLTKVHQTVNAQQDKIKMNPPREVTLLNALKQFSNNGSMGGLDQTINMLMMINTARNMQNELQSLVNAPKETIYQISSSDNQNIDDVEQVSPRAAGITGLILTLALMNKI